MKRISLNPENITALVEEFKQSLANLKTNQEKIVFEKNFKDILAIDESKVKKPIIYFSNDAWLKMNALVQSSDKELAWQATVEKRKFKNKENSKDFFYYIDQVYVYPQKVTPTFVDTDEVEYTEWSLKLPDEVFNSLRFQGHSHVNMAVGPSGTDMNTYQNFLDQLEKDDFYIFMILNKRGDFNIMLYDFAQDIIFETKDCYTDVLTRTGGLDKWLNESKALITQKVAAPPTTAPRESWDDAWEETFHSKGTEIQTGITWSSTTGYMRNGHWYQFRSELDAMEFYEVHPELIDKASLNANFKTRLLMFIENKSKHQKKKGRPAKVRS